MLSVNKPCYSLNKSVNWQPSKTAYSELVVVAWQWLKAVNCNLPALSWLLITTLLPSRICNWRLKVSRLVSKPLSLAQDCLEQALTCLVSVTLVNRRL